MKRKAKKYIRRQKRRRNYTLFLAFLAVITFLITELVLSRPSEAAVLNIDDETGIYIEQTGEEQSECEEYQEMNECEEYQEMNEGAEDLKTFKDNEAADDSEDQSGPVEGTEEPSWEKGNSEEPTAAEPKSTISDTEEITAYETEEPEELLRVLLFEEENNYKVKVSYTESAGLPDNVRLAVKEIPADSEEYKQYYHAAYSLLDENTAEDHILIVEFARFFDISLISENDGVPEEIEPEPGSVLDVQITFEAMPDLHENAVPAVVHFASELTDLEIIEAELVNEEEQSNEEDLKQDDGEKTPDTFVFEQSSFSPIGILAASQTLSEPIVTSSDYNIHALAAVPLTDYSNLNDLESGKYVITVQYNNHWQLVNSGRGFRPVTVKDEEGVSVITDLNENEIWDITRTEDDGKVSYYISNAGRYINPLEGTAITDIPTSVSIVSMGDGFNTRLYAGGDTGRGRYLRCESNQLCGGVAYGAAHTFYLAKVVRDYDMPNYASKINTTDEIEDGFYLIRYRGNYNFAADITTYEQGKDRTWYATDGTSVLLNGGAFAAEFPNSVIWYIEKLGNGQYTIQSANGVYLSEDTEKAILDLSVNGNDSFVIKSGEKKLVYYPAGNNLLFNTGFVDDHANVSFFLYKLGCSVWFDGTNGGNKFYTRNYQSIKAEDSWYRRSPNDALQLQVRLPVQNEITKQNTPAYDYKLAGWLDIVNKRYYSVLDTDGSELNWVYADMYGDTVFYAYWIASTYDIGKADPSSDGAQVVDTPDTSSFITTAVYDYNELYNLFSCDLSEISIRSDSHSEIWRIVSEGNAYFGQPTRNLTFMYGGNEDGNLADAIGRNNPDHRNQSFQYSGSYYPDRYNPYGYNGIVVNNLASVPDDPSIQLYSIYDAAITGDLFNDLNFGAVKAGNDNHLYNYDPETGYYYFDSTKNAATYNRSAHRFYVYDKTNMTNKSINKNWSDFLPFNYGRFNDPVDHSSYRSFTEADGEIDYWFGLRSDIQFYLPNDSGTGGNIAANGDPMIYKFSGDDDVWVLVDDQLILDLGGVHDSVFGEINFSDGTVTIGDKGTSKDMVSKTIGIDESDGRKTQFALPKIRKGNHRLTIYYMERGSSESNAAIYFNIAPSYELNFAKLDTENAQKALNDPEYSVPKWSSDSEYHDFQGRYAPLSGAKFKIYLDPEKTEEADLDVVNYYTSKDSSSGSIVYSSKKGIFRFQNLIPNRRYYLEEIEAPPGYSKQSGLLEGIIQNDVLTIRDYETQKILLQTQARRFQTDSEDIHYVDTWVENRPGYVLPETGGYGVRLFKGGGVLLLLIGGILLLRRKRNEVMRQ